MHWKTTFQNFLSVEQVITYCFQPLEALGVPAHLGFRRGSKQDGRYACELFCEAILTPHNAADALEEANRAHSALLHRCLSTASSRV
jgi:hypothetical protein